MIRSVHFSKESDEKLVNLIEKNPVKISISKYISDLIITEHGRQEEKAQNNNGIQERAEQDGPAYGEQDANETTEVE